MHLKYTVVLCITLKNYHTTYTQVYNHERVVKNYNISVIRKKIDWCVVYIIRGRSRNCERGGGGLAPCKVKCPPRRVQGHAPLENVGIIHSNFLQSESKILMLDLRGSVYCAFVCMKCH